MTNEDHKWELCECDICTGDLTCGDCAFFEMATGTCQHPTLRGISLEYAGEEYQVSFDTPACHGIKEV
jgi:hypothetical protein